MQDPRTIVLFFEASSLLNHQTTNRAYQRPTLSPSEPVVKPNVLVRRAARTLGDVRSRTNPLRVLSVLPIERTASPALIDKSTAVDSPHATNTHARLSWGIEAGKRISVKCAGLPSGFVPLAIFISKYLNGQHHPRRTQIILSANSVIDNFAVCSNRELHVTPKMPSTPHFTFILPALFSHTTDILILS